MERKVGEVFEYRGVKLHVRESTSACTGCYFHYCMFCKKYSSIAGECVKNKRTDKTNIIFLEYKEKPKRK